MRVFEGDTADQCWLAAVQDLGHCGVNWSPQPSRAGPTREYIHASFLIRNPAERWVVSRSPSLNPAFALAEVLWILAGRNDTAFLTFFNRKYPKFIGSGETCHGAYGLRVISVSDGAPITKNDGELTCGRVLANRK